jgi:hypothetical protein
MTLMTCAAGLVLSGCVSAPRTDAGPISTSRPLASPAAAGSHAASQVVRGAFGMREMTLSCVVSIDGNAMSVVGLNAMGVRLFTIHYDGNLVSVEKTIAVPDALTPERLLADLQLVFWPLKSLQQTLSPAGFEVNEPAAGTRRLRHGERLVAEVHYSSDYPWTARTWLVNFEPGYSLQIDSRAP